MWAALGLILLVGAAFRFQALDWDQGQFFHPDERAIIQRTLWLNEVPLTTDEYGPRQHTEFPPGGLSFFIPNGKSSLRPPTPDEAQNYLNAKSNGQTFKLPANVVPPDQPIPAEALNFWNASYSPLNPHWFPYGSFPMYLIKFGGHVMSGLTGQVWYDWEHLTLIGRFLSGLFSLGTIGLVFLLGRLVFRPALGRNRSDAIGLLAAAFMSVSVLDIQLAHYAAFDVALTFFMILAVYLSVRLSRSEKWQTAIGLGAAIGLALSCKISAVPVISAAVTATLLYGLYGRADESGETAGQPRMLALPGPETERYGPNGVALGPRLLRSTSLNLIIVGLVTVLVWFIAMPYAFLDFSTWIARVIEEAGMSRGTSDAPYTRQYVGTIPFLYQAGNLVQWGLGIPLGLLALVGTGYSLWKAVSRRFKTELVLVVYLLVYSLTTFTAEAKFDRYLLPITPILVILAARFVVEFATAKKATGQRWAIFRPRQTANPSSLVPPSLLRSWIMSGIGLFAFVWAGVWAISFSQIYSSEHTMNQATRWMMQNVAPGASYSNELWDESLPTRITNESFGSRRWCDPEVLNQNGSCVPVSMDLYGDLPNDAKVDYFVNQLKKTDYITIASNRLYATMSKLPWRYPIQIRYYELLFSGKLGFENVATFTDYPKIPLLGWEINDSTADESFTVYDHPKVLIFKKTKPLSDEEIRGLFANASKTPWVAKRYPGPKDLPVRFAGQGDGVLDSATAGQYREDGKTLLLDQPVDRLPVIDDMSWNKPANDNQWLAVVVWFALIQLLGLVALPIAWRVCRRLPDRGYILAKPLGAVIVALVIWLMVWTRLVMNTAWTAWLALGLTAAFSAWLWWHNRVELTGWLLAHRRIILLEETLFLGVFGGWVLFRLGNPDLWHPFYGGEKPMEMTHMLGILRSPYFPPYDPWFADGYINYYYYGQYLVATWIKLSGISPYIAFNLAVPVLYAFTCTAGFSLVFNMTLKYKRHRARLDQTVDPERIGGPMTAGLFGMVIFAFVGNFDGFLQVLQRFKPIADLATNWGIYPDPVKRLEKFDYFRSSRVIPGTINEFPAFSFIYADMHAHLIALPYTLVAMALGFNLISTNWRGHSETKADGRPDFFQMTIGRLWQVFDRTLVTPIIAMIVIGFLGATNSWDLPTYLLVITAGFFLALFRRYFATKEQHDDTVGEDGLAIDEEQPLEARNQPKPRFTLPSVMIDLVLTGAVLGVTLVGSFGLYWNFFGHFYAFFSKIDFLPDRLPTYSYDNITTISGRTEFKYFLVIFILPLFLILSYLLWNGFNWSGRRSRLRPLASRPDGSDNQDYEEDEDELDDYEDAQPARPGASRQPQPYQPTLPGFGLRLKRPELALAMSGADAGSNSGWGRGSGPGFGAASPGPAFNRFARPWLIGLIAFSLFFIGVGIVAPNNWLVFMFALSLFTVCLVLTFVRPFDLRHSEQSAEALDESSMFMRVMLLGALGLIAVTEVIYLVDDMGGEYTRMNTVFKFYYQVWALITLAAAFGGYVVWMRWIAPSLSRPGGRSFWSRASRFIWIGLGALILFCVGLYPIQAIPSRLADRGSDPIPAATLDGRAYFKTLQYVSGMPNMPPGKVFDLRLDAQSLFEFYDKVKGTPVVLQASIWPYRGGGSWIPINTGLPTVLGWDHHERQQRWPGMVSNRSENGAKYGMIRQIYTTTSIQEALELLNHFHVTYIHLGTIERDGEVSDICDGGGACTYEPFMSEDGYAKFEQMTQLGLLEVAYQNPGVVVYKLTAKGESGVITGDPKVNGGTVTITDPKLSKLEAAIKAQPNTPQPHYNLGQYYYTKHNYDKAAEELLTVIKLEPNRVNPYHVLGDIYRDGGDIEKALAQYKKATEIPAPPDEIPPAFNKYGVALQMAGRYDEAIKQFDETLKRNNRFNEAYFHKGEVYEAQGKKDLALEMYQQTILNSQKRDDFWTVRSNQKIRELSGK